MNERVNQQKANAKGLSLTPSATNHLKKQLIKHGSQMLGVRLTLNKTGCSGLSYHFEFIEQAPEQDKRFQFEDLIVFVDHKYFPYLNGISIDYVREGINYKYVYDNPNQTGQCGCGESFTISETN